MGLNSIISSSILYLRLRHLNNLKIAGKWQFWNVVFQVLPDVATCREAAHNVHALSHTQNDVEEQLDTFDFSREMESYFRVQAH